MAYKDFSIESAILPNYGRRSVKIEGAATAVKIMQNPSRATEDYIQGAVTAIGAANRNILYVNASLEGLNDRLRIASKLAYAVNTSKRRGMEGFEDVPMMNPWSFALEEEKEGGFFKRVWEAIKTICRRIIEAIAHLIKWIANAFAGLDTKSQVKHYKLYKENISKLSADKKKDVDKIKIKAPKWKMTPDKVSAFVTKALQRYQAMTTDSTKGKDVEALGKLAQAGDWSQVNVGALSILTNDAEFKTAKAACDKMLAEDIKAIFTNPGEKTKASDLVKAEFIDGDKKEETTCGEMVKHFDALAEGKLAKQAKDAISTLHKHQKEFTAYTKQIDKFVTSANKNVVKDIKKDDKDGKKNAKVNTNSISNKLSMITNSRVRYNSYWTGLMLEIQSMVLRYNKSAHVAMKFYLKELKVLSKGEKKNGKKDETKAETAESLFNFI